MPGLIHIRQLFQTDSTKRGYPLPAPSLNSEHSAWIFVGASETNIFECINEQTYLTFTTTQWRDCIIYLHII